MKQSARPFEIIGEEIVVKELFKFKKILDEHGVRFFLIGGLLLGAVREQKILMHDKDLDMGILEETKLEDVKELLEKHGYQCQIARPDIPDGKFMWVKKRIKNQDLVFEIVQYHIKEDIAYINKDMGKSFKKSWRKGHMEYPARYFEDLKEIEFYGETFLTPNTAKEFLATDYGDWEVEHIWIDWRYVMTSLREGWVIKE